MDARTLKALKGSIRKWERIVQGTGQDDGSGNCPLCRLFIHEDCKGCPVSRASGQSSCLKTPYMEWNGLFAGRNGMATSIKKKHAAQRELDFLKSLLPKKPVPRKKK